MKSLEQGFAHSKGDMLAIIIIFIIAIIKFGLSICHLCNFQSQADLHFVFLLSPFPLPRPGM